MMVSIVEGVLNDERGGEIFLANCRGGDGELDDGTDGAAAMMAPVSILMLGLGLGLVVVVVGG